MATMTKTKSTPRAVNSKLETMVFTRADVNEWAVPPFQRPLRVNDKVRAMAEELKHNGGIMNGVITLGMLPRDKSIYLVDGQHRREAFRISELPEGMSDVRTCMFEDMAHMAEAFVQLQQSLVSMRPDDILRGLEGTTRSLQVIRQTCPFVGYDNIRRNAENAPLLSMALILRSWTGSRGDTPSRTPGHRSTPVEMAKEIDDLELTNLCKFLHVAHAAWGRDVENARLWASLNIGMCMWMYRRLVLDQDRTQKRSMTLTTDQFKKCLMALSADGDYHDWLVARVLNDHHRNPCYRRIRAIFSARLKEDKVSDAPKFPQPAWAVS